MGLDNSFDWTIFDRFFAGDASPEDHAQLDSWLRADPSREAFWLAFREVNAKHTDIPASWDTQRMLDRLSAHRMATAAPDPVFLQPAFGQNHVSVPYARGQAGQQVASTKRSTLPRVLWSSAAALVLVVAVMVFGWTTGVSRVSQQVAGTTLTYETVRGELRSFRLPDGSAVALGEASRLEVPADFRSGGHPLRLQGEAAFTVQHRSSGSFTVMVPGATVRVLGTTFLVRRYASDTAAIVVVHDGKVNVSAVGMQSVVLTGTRLVVVGQGSMREATEEEVTRMMKVGDMNPMALLSRLTAMASSPVSAGPADSLSNLSLKGWTGRVVVGEYKTGINCGTCQPQESALDTLMKRYPSIAFIPLAYHHSGSVPISNLADSTINRWYDWWGESSAGPTGEQSGVIHHADVHDNENQWEKYLYIDGHAIKDCDIIACGSAQIRNIEAAIDAELHKAPEAELHVEATPRGGTIIARVQVTSLSKPPSDVSLRIVVIEDTVNLKVTDTAEFNQREDWNRRLNHYMVVRAAARDSKYPLGIRIKGTGTVSYTFDMAKTQEQRLHYRDLALGYMQPKSDHDVEVSNYAGMIKAKVFAGKSGWVMDPTRLHVVAFLQDVQTGDVLQAQMVHVNTGLHGELLKLPSIQGPIY